MAQTIVTGKQLYAPFRVTFDNPPAGQRLFNFVPAAIGGHADINDAKSIEMYVDGLLRKKSEHVISGLLEITSDDPQNVNPAEGWDANCIEFIFTFI